METVRLKYIGKHQPQQIIEVDKNRAEKLLKTKNYELVDKDVRNKTTHGRKGGKPSKEHGDEQPPEPE